MPRLFSIKPGITMRGRKFKGLRGWAGKPSHPPLTDIPVAAFILAAVFDLISFIAANTGGNTGYWARDFFKAATFVLVGGLIVSVPTALTGFWDWLRSTPKHTQAWRTANWHMAVMLTTIALVIVDIVVRVSAENDDETSLLALVLSLLAGGLVTFGAAYGGSLVYDYGFNVETSGDHPVWHESEHDVMPGDPH